MTKVILYVSALCTVLLWGATGRAQEQQPDNDKLLELYQTQQYREAAVYLQTFYPDTITDPAVLGRLGYCYHMAGDYVQAERYYQQLYAMDSLRVSTLLNLATLNVQRRFYPKATGYYLRIIAIDSNHVSAYRALSQLMKRSGNAASAYDYLQRANSIQPLNSDIAFDFAQLCLDLERYGRADSVLQRALEADPNHGLLLLGKIKVADKMKRYQEVITAGEQLLKQGDESQQVLSLVARGYFHTDDFIRSKETYGRMLAAYGEMGEVDYYYLAMTHKAMKRYQEGLECMDKVLALAISPNTAFYYGRKGDLHDLANQPSAAVSNYLRSFQFEVIPLHYYSMAIVYDRKLSDARNALRYYRQYLKQNPPEEERIYIDYVQKRIKELE